MSTARVSVPTPRSHGLVKNTPRSMIIFYSSVNTVVNLRLSLFIINSNIVATEGFSKMIDSSIVATVHSVHDSVQ